jgi:hypothetical protein
MISLNQLSTDRDRTITASSAAPAQVGIRISGDVLCCLLLTAIVVGVFWKTIVLGLPISRIGLIAEWDSLFSALRRGSALHIDPSAVLLALPTYTTIAQHFHSMQFPLWNNLNAFGSPLVGDVQATVFSPLRVLFNLFPNMQTYNLQLVFQVEIAALTTFLLSRNLGAGRIASVAAAISYAFCPFILWYLELQSGVGYALNPLVFWLFVRMARKAEGAARNETRKASSRPYQNQQNQAARAAMLAGLGSGATIMMGHPETSFFAILFGCAAAAVLMWPRALECAKLVALAGVAAFCTCAPTFLPFLEYAKNSDCYKYSIAESAFVPWQAIVANLLSPVAGGASPFLGVLAVAFALCAFAPGARRRPALSMGVVALATFILAAKLFPFSLVSHTPPFNYLITVYAVPLFLLAAAVLFAIGLTNVSERPRWSAIVAIAIVVAAPFVMNVAGFDWQSANFDMTLPGAAFNNGAWRKDLIIAALSVVAFVMLYRRNKLALTVIVLLNAVSILCVTKSAIPAQPKFELPQLPVMQKLQQSGERVLAAGTHLAKPDVNLLYGVDDVRSINAMLPPRYISFVKACGASADQFTQWFGDEVSPVIDFGSVRYIISQSPVTSTSGTERNSQSLVSPLPGREMVTDLDNKQVCGYVDWKFDKPAKWATVTLSDAAGRVVWFSDREPVNASSLRQRVRVPLPTNEWSKYTLGAVIDDHNFSLGAVPAPAATKAQSRLRLREIYDGGVRLYENTTALPRAYFATSYVVASSPNDALNKLRDTSTVVLESAPGFVSSVHPISAIKLIERRSDFLSMEYDSDREGVVVVTDTFYPGWKAFIDGKQVPILRANYLFRGVQAAAGHHTLTMRYIPESFTIGVLLLLAFWGFAVVALARKAI